MLYTGKIESSIVITDLAHIMASKLASKFVDFQSDAYTADAINMYWTCVATVGNDNAPAKMPPPVAMIPVIRQARQRVARAIDSWAPQAVCERCAQHRPEELVREMNRELAEYTNGINQAARDACGDLFNAFHK